ncbi:RloB family protein [Methylobacterium sp. Leaf399]|uniref:RloB family protein n=1 Tax=Methylobacterium sp. Leaf399 TaxID=1736364 RepID=UPI00138F4582|nr:RloB family protein [Methylobacterium sp. Leaf399]
MINSQGGRSSPAHIMENMQTYIDSYEIGGGDELWLVLDRDAWHPRMISQVATLCKQKQVRLAVSNPCFELWLAHHFDDVLPKPLDCASLQNHLRQCMQIYNKSSYNAGCLLGSVNKAIENAKKLDKNPNSRWPHPAGTRVHELAYSILTSI